MLKSYGIDDSRIFKIAVVATMSSGKSTFINALMGTEILPSQNQACTAKIIPILNNDSAKDFKAYIDYSDGKKDVIALKGNNVVDRFNEENEIKQMLIEGDIKSIKNYNRAAVIIDTPGTNFSGDLTHQEETYKLLDKLEDGLILYIINATQFGINDDSELMLHIKQKIKKSQNKLKILFVVNKIDEFDLQKENIEQTMSSICEYIEGNGIKNPKIIPISALAAKLFRQVINREKLTRREKREFNNYYDLFKNSNYSLNRFAYMHSKSNETIEIDGGFFSEYDLLQAIDNTGINLVGNEINELLFNEFNKYTPKIDFKKEKNDYDKKSEQTVERIITDLLKIYKDGMIFQKAKRIKVYAKNKKFHNSTYEKLKQIYNDAYSESAKIMMNCIMYKYSDNGRLKKIVNEAINNIEITVKNDKNNLKIIINVMSGRRVGKSTLINSIIGDSVVTNDLNHYNIEHKLPGENVVLKELDPCDIKKMKEVCIDSKNIIMYVANVTRFGINEDSVILEMIANQMKTGGKQSKDRFMFVINKCDEYDIEKDESIEKLLKYFTEYLSKYGIEEPNLFPVSAQTAKIIRMKQRGIELTRREKKDLSVYEDFIDILGFHFEKMASLSKSCRMKIEYKLNAAIKEENEYEEALIHTGIPGLKEYIQEYIENAY